MQKIISIKNGVTRMPEWRMAEPVNFEACDGEHIAIVGPNGGGKSMFVDIIVGRHPLLMHDPDYDFSPSQKTMVSDNIKYITFRDTYGGDNDRTYFLQQRWNQLEIDENTPVVKDKLEEAYQMAGEDTPERRALQQHIYELFHMQHLMDKYTIRSQVASSASSNLPLPSSLSLACSSWTIRLSDSMLKPATSSRNCSRPSLLSEPCRLSSY